MAIKEFKERELEGMLKRIFVRGEADFFIVDIRGSKKSFLKSSLQYGIDNGLLDRKKLDDDTYFENGMYIYRLTKKGKNYFGIRV